MRTLDNIFEEVVEKMTGSINLDTFEGDDKFGFSYENDGYLIEGDICLTGKVYGDDFLSGRGRISNLEINYIDEDTDEEFIFPASEVDKFENDLNNVLVDFINVNFY